MSLLLILVFIIGFIAITFEHQIHLDKSATAIITGALCWTIYITMTSDKELVLEQLYHHLGEYSSILFFLLGAMTIVEVIDSHSGFDIIINSIKQTNKVKLIWIISFIAFFLSAILDNLTTTIVMVSLLRKLLSDRNDRLLFVGLVIIAANAGGAWSPLGDVTTTMLWIGGQISAGLLVFKLILPSLICVIIPLAAVTFRLKGNIQPKALIDKDAKNIISKKKQLFILLVGVFLLLFVPIFKTITHLPPFMGMLLSLGILWTITEYLHGSIDYDHKSKLSVAAALRKIDTPSVLFFLGILLSVGALQSKGVLGELATWLSSTLPNMNFMVICIGLISAIVDNVPLVAGMQGMYDLNFYPKDHAFWIFLAYCAGTGGSTLIIGSAAGVAAMGMERITFGWYLKKITPLALMGYFMGAFVFMLFESLSK